MFWSCAPVPTVAVIMCAAALLVGGRVCGDAPEPTIRTGHPRLFVTPDDLPRLTRQTAAYPDEWARMLDAGLWTSDDAGYGSARALTTAALVYLITNDERYLRNALVNAETICRNHRFNQYASPEAVFALALAYDWCYHGLSPAQREEIQQAILRIADYCRDELWRHSDFCNHFALEKVWPDVFTALALYGDLPDPRVEQYLKLGSQYLRAHLLPAANLMAGTTGGQFEGYGYDSWGYMRPLAYVLEAWRTATGEDLFPSCTATANNALWNIYGRRPFDGKQEHFDDAGLEQAWSDGNETHFAYLIARRHRDGRAQWLGDQIERRYNANLWPVLLWRDPEIPAVPPSDLPTARLFDSLGWVLMRSSWEPDATFASFQCGPFLAGHQHLDNNSFTIHKRALLAIDPGVNAYGEGQRTDYRTNYYSRTIAHNTITVYDPHETFPGGPWAGDDDSPAANDGGQIRMRAAERVDEVTPDSRFFVGRIAAYRHGDLYTYAVGDATRSYSASKLRLFRRHFLYLPPDLFVIFDQVEAVDPSFRKTWLLHCVDEPLVNGSISTVVNGPGRLTVRTVLPRDAEITVVGGPGRECWVDGRNWPPIEKEWERDAGAWRLEVSPARPAAQDLFLHVLQTDGADIALPAAVSLIEQGGRVGVRVSAQGRRYDVTFSTDGPSAHLAVVEDGRHILDQELP